MTEQEIQAINTLFGMALQSCPHEQRLQIAREANGLLEKIRTLVEPKKPKG